jgi:hypothetical protein
MRFEFRCSPALPRLAWCAHLHRNSSVVRVGHALAVMEDQLAGALLDRRWHSKYLFAFHWGVERVRPRYAPDAPVAQVEEPHVE